MTGFGSALKAERERCGLTLERVCEETRVSLRFLEAVEAEEYATLPGGVFRKGIVRAYLKTLGLAEPEWMPRFQSSLQAFAARTGTPLENDDAAWVEFAENVKRNRIPGVRANNWRWAGLAGMLLVLVAFGVGGLDVRAEEPALLIALKQP